MSNPNQRAQAPPFRSQSSETINTNFSPGGLPPRFTSNPPTPRESREPSRVRTSPIKTQPSSDRPAPGGAQATSNERSRPPSSAAAFHPSNHERYSNEDWAKHFQPDTSTYPPPLSRSPTRAQTRKRPNTPAKPFGPATKRPTAMPQTNGTFSPEDPQEQRPAMSEPSTATESINSRNTVSDDSAMDIDTPPSRHASDPKISTPRNDVNDRRPSFQAEQVGVTPRPKGPPVPPRPKSHVDTTNVTSSAPPTSQDQPEINDPLPDPHNPLNLSSLKSTAPFTPSNGTSINNLADLSASLPFSSRPSAAPTPNEEPADQNNSYSSQPAPRLDLPKPPKGPSMPEGKLYQLSFDRHLALMRTYMTEWNAYNAIMLAHFNERQARAVESMEGEFGGHWLNALGESGFRSYTRGWEEEFWGWELWFVCGLTHGLVLGGWAKIRERVVKGVLL